MTATNHALTGAAIGLLLGEPLLAIPAAVASHFACDALPHFKAPGYVRHGDRFLRSRWFRNYLLIEAAVCGLIVLTLAFRQPLHWQLAAICAFLAAAPDLLSIRIFRAAQKNMTWRAKGYYRFSKAIQWFERPIGAAVEIAWFVALVAIIAPFLR